MAGATVCLEGVSKRHGSGPGGVVALNDCNLNVAGGEFVSVVGPSGCGKSTLLNLIAGVDVPSSGTVTVEGHDLARLSDDARSDLRLRHVGFVFQSFNLFPAFTAHDNVAWPLRFLGHSWKAARPRASDALARVGLDESVTMRRPGALSGGEQQRVAIARALVADPTLLVADEPTGNLDSQTGQRILTLLRQLNQERQVTVIMVTHSAVAAAFGDRTVALRDGCIVGDSPSGAMNGRSAR